MVAGNGYRDESQKLDRKASSTFLWPALMKLVAIADTVAIEN